jgi:hypothetical protein
MSYNSGDHSRIQNALLNITLNGRDAIKGAGTLKIETTRMISERMKVTSYLILNRDLISVSKFLIMALAWKNPFKNAYLNPFLLQRILGKEQGWVYPQHTAR